MSILAGPFLKFVRASQSEWVVSAIVVGDLEQAPTMSWAIVPSANKHPPSEASEIHHQQGKQGMRFVHRFQWAVPRTPQTRTVQYAVEDRSYRFPVPGSAAPVRLRMGYASCNGFHSVKDAKRVAPNAIWGNRPTAGATQPEEFGAACSVLHQRAKDPIHLLLLAGVPVVYPKYPAFVEGIMGIWPGQAAAHLDTLDDDLRDHWRSGRHTGERIRLIHRLLRFARDNDCRVTILSGDVHLAALGLIESTRESARNPNTQSINQLISSPIVNLPQPRTGQLALQMIINKKEIVDRRITATMECFPETDSKIVATRNWLSLDLEPDRKMWANWWIEGQPNALTKAIHAPGQS